MFDLLIFILGLCMGAFLTYFVNSILAQSGKEEEPK